MIKFQSSEKTAVLLLAFGGPDSPSAIEPFLYKVLGEKRLLPEKIAQIKSRYMAIGGKSPLLEITTRQAELLQNMIGDNFKVFTGMRFWNPFISDVLVKIKDEGFRQIIAIPMTPYYCSVSTGAYKKEFEEALKPFGENYFVTKFIPNWHNVPLFHEAIVDTMKNAAQLSGCLLSEFHIIFSAHSVPEKIIDEGDPYLKEIRGTIEEIIKLTGPVLWDLGFQSKGGGTFKWLGPEISEIFDKIIQSENRMKNILLVPVGFISDHVETLYDIDKEINEEAHKRGLKFQRAKALNDHPKFIEALSFIVKSAIK